MGRHFSAHAHEMGSVISNNGSQVDTALAIVPADPQCLTGEILGSLRCDCHDQLGLTIAGEGAGLVMHEYQEGSGVGLMANLQAHELKDAGLDKVQANHALGFKADCSEFLPAAILLDLGVSRVRLLTNNPCEVRAPSEARIEVAEPIPCDAALNARSFAYLQAKEDKMEHTLILHGSERARSLRANRRLNSPGVFLVHPEHPE